MSKTIINKTFSIVTYVYYSYITRHSMWMSLFVWEVKTFDVIDSVQHIKLVGDTNKKTGITRSGELRTFYLKIVNMFEPIYTATRLGAYF